MAYEVIINKRFINKLKKVLAYLDKEWGTKVADDFLELVFQKIDLIQAHPYIGALTNIRRVRVKLIEKHNKMYYRIENNKIVILSLYDTRTKNNKYN